MCCMHTNLVSAVVVHEHKTLCLCCRVAYASECWAVWLIFADMQVAKCLNLSAYKVAQHHRAALAVLQSSESIHHLASAF